MSGGFAMKLRSHTHLQNENENVQRASSSSVPNSWIHLNVGGKVFMTTRQTLCAEEGSFLARLVHHERTMTSGKDDSGAILIDRDPDYFRCVLNYLRHREIVLDDPKLTEQGLLEEAKFYSLPQLIAILEQRKKKEALVIINYGLIRAGDDDSTADEPDSANYLVSIQPGRTTILDALKQALPSARSVSILGQ